MTSVVDAAKELARAGFSIFPCDPDKRPHVKKWADAATTDETVIRQWWRDWPDAMIGLPTGSVSGLYVIDLDIDKDTGEVIGEQTVTRLGLKAALHGAPSVLTPTGGRHFYFRHPGEGWGNTARRLGGGVDTRGEGGYVIAPGSCNGAGAYQWSGRSLFDCPPPELPVALRRAILGTEATPSFASRTGTCPQPVAEDAMSETAWAQTALSSEVRSVAEASEGQRNDTLNRAAFNLGQLVGGQCLDQDLVERELREAAKQCGLPDNEVGPTISSGVAAGLQVPRRAPQRQAATSKDAIAGGPAADRQMADPWSISVVDPWAEHVVPEFPLNCLPPILKHWVEAQSKTTGADPAAFAMAALCTVSGAITHETNLPMKTGGDWVVSPRLWVMLVGPPSRMKTPVVKAATKPLHAAQRRLWDRHEAALDELPEGDRKEKPEPLRFVAADTTVEALGERLAQQDRGILIVRDELAGWIGAMDKYSGGKGAAADRAFWLQCFDGGDYYVDRIGRQSRHIRNLSASILGGIQPERLRQIGDLQSDGLLQRFLPVMMRRPVPDTDHIDEQAARNFDTLIKRLVEVPAKTAQMTPDAHEIRSQVTRALFEIGQSGAISDAFCAFAEKLKGVWGSLALCLCMAESSSPMVLIGEQLAEQARRIIFDFILPHAMAFYSDLGDTSHRQQMRDIATAILERADNGSVLKTRDLARGPRCCRGKAPYEIARMVGPFEAGGWVRALDPYPPPTRQWAINPHLRAQFAQALERERVNNARMRELIQKASSAR